MLKQRIIPKLQMGIRQGFRGLQPVLVVTNQFENRRAIGDPLSQAKIYEAQLADELILVDLERSEESWPILLRTLESISEALATPLAVGGGVRNFEQVQALLDRGADKIVINSGVIDDPKLINKISNAYGRQCVVVGIDIRTTRDREYSVWANGGRKRARKNAIDWAKEAVDRGAGEVLITDIEQDGTGKGLNLGLTRELKENLSVPLITSGGCGLAKHFVEGYQAGANAVAAGTFFCQRDQNPMQCRSQLINSGIKIRISH